MQMFNSSSSTLHNWDTRSSDQASVVWNSSSGCQNEASSLLFWALASSKAGTGNSEGFVPSQTTEDREVAQALPFSPTRSLYKREVKYRCSHCYKPTDKKQKQTSWKFLKVGTGSPGCSEQSRAFCSKLNESWSWITQKPCLLCSPGLSPTLARGLFISWCTTPEDLLRARGCHWGTCIHTSVPLCILPKNNSGKQLLYQFYTWASRGFEIPMTWPARSSLHSLDSS